MRKNIFSKIIKVKKIQYILVGLLCLLAFMVPQGRMYTPPILILLSVLSIIYFILRPKKDSWKILLPFLPLIGFYVYHILGVFYSSNPQGGFFDLEIKLSFVIFPMLFFFLGKAFWKSSFYYWIFASFVLGAAFWSALGMFEVFKDAKNLDEFKYLLSHYYSFINDKMYHTSYLSLYHNFSLGILLVSFAKNKAFFKRWYILIPTFILVFYMIASVILFASKAGALCLLGVMGFAFLYEVLWMRNYWSLLYYPFVVGGFVLISCVVYPSSLDRLSTMVTALQDEKKITEDGSTSTRIILWESALRSIAAHPIVGTGTGSCKTLIYENLSPEEKQIIGDYFMDAHNQYLYTAVCLGIIGLFLLLVILFYPIFVYKKQIATLYVLFALLFVFYMITESMLEQQLGIIFFCFFYCLLISKSLYFPSVSTVE